MWIARDKDECLFIFIEKPERYENEFATPSIQAYQIDRGLYPEVTWENSPIELVLNLKEE